MNDNPGSFWRRPNTIESVGTAAQRRRYGSLFASRMTSTLPKPIRAYVRAFVVRKRVYALLKSLGEALAIAVGWTILACALDRWLQLSSALRVALLVIGLLAVGVVLGPALARLLRRRIDWVGVADDIEQANPQFAERLRTVISQLLEREQYRGSPQMLDYLVDQVSQQ